MEKKYLFVVSTVNQVTNASLVIKQLSLNGIFEFVVFGARTMVEVENIEKAIEEKVFIHKKSFWLPQLSLYRARKAFNEIAQIKYSETFLFSYYTYYSLLGSLLNKAGNKVSLAEEGLGTYRVIVEQDISPLPLSLKYNPNRATWDNVIYAVLDSINGLLTKKQLISLMRFFPFFGAFFSRPFDVHRLVICYPQLLDGYFNNQIQNTFEFQSKTIDKHNADILNAIRDEGNTLIFASQPLIWDAFDSLSDMVRFLTKVANKYKGKLYFVPHPRDLPENISELINAFARFDNVDLLKLPVRQDIESIVKHTRPKVFMGFSTSALLYCRSFTRCESITQLLPKANRTPEIMYHDLIYQKVIGKLDEA